MSSDPDGDKSLVLYYRENCHLCESMRLALVRFSATHPLVWKEIDIDRDVELIRRFDTLVPVLFHRNDEVCHHFFDADALLQRLSS